MSKQMSSEEIRHAVEYLRAAYNKAMSEFDFEYARKLKDVRDYAIKELHDALNREEEADPYTTLADRLYYESQGD